MRGIHADVALSWNCVGEALKGQDKFMDATTTTTTTIGRAKGKVDKKCGLLAWLSESTFLAVAWPNIFTQRISSRITCGKINEGEGTY